MPEPAIPATVLIVDEDLEGSHLLEEALQREGLATTRVAACPDALLWLADHPADLLLVRLKPPAGAAPELARHLARGRRCVPYVLLSCEDADPESAKSEESPALAALEREASVAPWVSEAVKRALERAQRERRLVQAEAALRATEDRYRMLFELNPLPTWVYDLETLAFLAVNNAAVLHYGYTCEEFLRMTIKDIRPADEATKVSEFLVQLSHGAPPSPRIWRHLKKDRTPIDVEIVSHPVLFDGRKARLVLANDVTDRKRLEREILEISEREQRRIGQDLHDGLGQHLAGIELMSQVLEQNLGAKNRKEAARAGEIAGHVRDAISQTRSLARGLSPVLLEAEGLMPALADLAEHTQQVFGVACRWDCDPPVFFDEQAAATHLYRIAQEAVSNAIKHGKADRIVIRLSRAAERIILEVRDNGVGIGDEVPRGGGMGLRIMQYRADMIGGALVVRRGPDHGTWVTCSVWANPGRSRANSA
jgi:PAS domain S-box-containing protein